MQKFFYRHLPSLVKFHKVFKSRLNKDGLVLADAIMAFLLLTVLTVLFTGFMGTKIRTSPTVINDAEDQHASLTAIAQSVAKTSDVKDLKYDFHSYVPMRSISHPNTIAVYNNYDINNDKLTYPSGSVNEIISKNIIPSSSIYIHIHPTTNQWVQSVTTSKLIGAKFTFEPVENLHNAVGKPTEEGFTFTNREEVDNSRIKPLDSLNYPKDYGANEVMIYENTIK